MVWTVEKLARIPGVYRDFMTILKPVIESRRPEAIFRMTGIPFGMIVSALSNRYDYTSEQIRKVAENLQKENYVQGDELGFFVPTAKGEELIRAIVGDEAALEHAIPPLPTL